MIPRSLSICGLTYRVVFVTPGKGPPGWTKGQEGECNCDRGIIYLAARLRSNPTRLRDAFVHEVCHAISEGTGLRRWLKKLVPARARRAKASSDALYELEEDVVRIVTPALCAALESAGLIK